MINRYNQHNKEDDKVYDINPLKKIAPLIVGILVITVIILTVTGSLDNTLPEYQGDNSIQTPIATEETTEATTELEIDFFNYTDDNSEISIDIPKNWESLMRRGYQTFVHTPSGASIQIQKKDYEPSINNDTQESLQSTLGLDGYSLNQFEKSSTSSYRLLYSDDSNAYISYAFWDTKKIVKVLCTTLISDYDKIYPYFINSLNSISFNSTSPISNDEYIVYSENGNYEAKLLTNWTAGLSNGTMYANDESTNSEFTIMSSDSISDFENISKSKYIETMSDSASQLDIESFRNDSYEIVAVGTYVSDNSKIYFIQHIVKSNDIQYTLTFTCPYKISSQMKNTSTRLFSGFRYFE